jgi:hypothetical protein
LDWATFWAIFFKISSGHPAASHHQPRLEHLPVDTCFLRAALPVNLGAHFRLCFEMWRNAKQSDQIAQISMFWAVSFGVGGNVLLFVMAHLLLRTYFNKTAQT